METKRRAGLRVGGTMGLAAAGMVLLRYLGLPEEVAVAVVVLAGAGIRVGAQALGVAGLAGIVLLASGCAMGVGSWGMALGQAGVCSGKWRYLTPAEAEALGAGEETPTALPGERCEGTMVWGGPLSQQAVSAGEGVAGAASTVLPPIITGGP